MGCRNLEDIDEAPLKAFWRRGRFKQLKAPLASLTMQSVKVPPMSMQRL
jgi:hypothetical protein